MPTPSAYLQTPRGGRAARALPIVFFTLLLTGPAYAQLAAPNDAGVTFAHVHLSVADPALHMTLWTELFDAVPAEKGGYAAVRVPGALIFFTEQAPTAPSTDTVIDHFGLTVRDLPAILTAWRAHGHDVEHASSDATGTPRAALLLPGGVRLELVEDPSLPTRVAMDHVHFAAPRPARLRAWYADLFDLPPQPDGTAEATAYVPGATLIFREAAAERAPTDGTAIDHIGFEVEDFDAFVNRLQDQGIAVVFGPKYIERLDLWVVFFIDPSGALVEVSDGLDAW